MATQVKYKQVAKDSLFYGRWQYCIAFHLDEVSALKTLDHDYIDSLIQRRKTWISEHKQRWGKIPVIGSNNISRRYREITDEAVDNLHELADLLISTNIPFKLVTSVDNAWVYTSTKSLITKLSAITALTNVQYTEALVERPKNTIKLKNPKHTHRSYFKSIKLTDKEKDTLITFFVNQSNDIRISPAFSGWLLTPYYRSQDYFFMDHNGESWLVLLALIKSGLVRKTVDILPA